MRHDSTTNNHTARSTLTAKKLALESRGTCDKMSKHDETQGIYPPDAAAEPMLTTTGIPRARRATTCRHQASEISHSEAPRARHT